MALQFDIYIQRNEDLQVPWGLNETDADGETVAVDLGAFVLELQVKETRDINAVPLVSVTEQTDPSITGIVISDDPGDGTFIVTIKGTEFVDVGSDTASMTWYWDFRTTEVSSGIQRVIAAGKFVLQPGVTY